MSKVTVQDNTGNFAIIESDISKIFVFDNQFRNEILRNASGGVLDFLAGTVLGRISASLKLVPVASAAVDGSEIPIAVLAEDIIQLADATDQAVTNVCIGGDVAEEKIILDGADTLDTLIGGRTIRDLLNSTSLGIRLVTRDDLTGFDNV